MVYRVSFQRKYGVTTCRFRNTYIDARLAALEPERSPCERIVLEPEDFVPVWMLEGSSLEWRRREDEHESA